LGTCTKDLRKLKESFKELSLSSIKLWNGGERSMATDYDTPRKTDEELHEESLEELKARRAEAQSGQVDLDEEEAENVELPGADLSGEELAVRVVPKQENEFTCSRCFLVHHITQLAKGEGAKAICKDCA
jgi:hypothetical protein